MTEIFELEDKISNIRKAVRNITGDTHPSYPRALEEQGRNKSFDKFLNGRFEDNRELSRLNQKDSSQGLDFSRDIRFSNNSYKGPYSNKITTSFLSDDFPSLKANEKEISDLCLLLDYEREKTRKLEQRVLQKDEIIESMNQRQNSLTEELAAAKRQVSYDEIEEYKVQIANLQDKLEKYMNQVSFLQTRQADKEELVSKINYLEHQMKDQPRVIEELHNKSTKIMQDSALISDLKLQIEKKDKILAEVLNENKELVVRLNEAAPNKNDPRQDFRELKLKEELNKLKLINEDLCRKVENNQERRGRDISNDRGRRRSCSNTKFLTELVEALKCGKGEIMSKIKQLKRSEKLEKRLVELIRDLSKQKDVLNTKDVWKCIRKLVEEYVGLKKGDTLGKICSLLCVTESQVYEEVKKVCDERKNVKKLIEKVKNMLSLGPHAALQDIEEHLDSKV